MGYIYKITNDLNDKIYIGQTINSIEYRFRCHFNEAKNDINKQNKFHKALLELGIEHFKIELVEECLDNDLNEREQYWIRYYDSVNKGYNSTWGGTCGFRYDRNELLNLWNQGHNIQKISDITGMDRDLLGQVLKIIGIQEEEIKKRHYETAKIQSTNRAVYQINISTGEIIKKWDRISDAEHALHISHSIIVNCCSLKPQAKTAGGFAWRYVEDYNPETDKEQLIKYTKRIPHNSKTILQFDKNYNLINEFINATEASQKISKSPSTIKKYCRNESKDPNGFIWQYK